MEGEPAKDAEKTQPQGELAPITQPTNEVETIAKAELEKLRAMVKAANANAYDRRKAETDMKALRQRIAEMEEERANMPAVDVDTEEVRKQIVRERREFQAQLEAEKKVLAEEKLRLKAVALASEHGVDVTLLADARSETEMENIALKALLTTQKEQAATPKNLDLGKGGGSASFAAIREAYINNPYDERVYAAYQKARAAKGLSTR